MSITLSSVAESTQKTRDVAIDVVRGMAIFTMVGANMGPMLPEPHSWFYRWYSTFAAPTFVVLAGCMVSLAFVSGRDRAQASYFVKRGLFICLMGAFVDLGASQIMPFISADVLYLIGFSLPLWFIINNLSTPIILGLIALLTGLTAASQYWLGYGALPTIIPITNWFDFGKISLDVLAIHWFVDGWFPILPWFAYGLVGVLLGRLRFSKSRMFTQLKNRILCITLLLLVGFTLFWAFPGPLFSRIGYSELFYPPTLGFMCLSIGVVFLAISIVDWSPKFKLWQFFRPYGECSLFMYIFHSFIIGWVFLPWAKDVGNLEFVFLCSTLLGCMWVFGVFLRKFKKTFTEMPLVLRWVVGG